MKKYLYSFPHVVEIKYLIILFQIVKIQRMFRRYRKRREEADERKALMENQNYDVFDYEDTDLDLEEE